MDKFEQLILDELKAPDNDVYHYTTQEGFNQIFRTMYLFLNSHKELNIKNSRNRELEIAENLIFERLNDNNILKSENITPNLFLDFMRRGIQIYTTSFSKSRSPAMHREYGEYCITFRLHSLEKFRNDNRRMLFGNVIYEKEKQISIIEELFRLFFDTNDQDIRENINLLFIWLIAVMPFFKQDTCRGEDECRIIHYEGYNISDGKLLEPHIPKKFNFCSGDIGDIFYLPA